MFVEARPIFNRVESIHDYKPFFRSGVSNTLLHIGGKIATSSLLLSFSFTTGIKSTLSVGNQISLVSPKSYC